jgi:uncharacterized protein (TIGR02453 family)
MSSTTIPVTVAPDAFAFLENLAANNDREWFNANKKTFATELERPFVHLLETLSARLTDASRPLSGGKATVFRMNRDVRFSDDKRPYKTNLSGLLTPSGTKKELGGIVYLHLDAQGGFAAAGLYNLTPAQLGPIRDTMIADAKGFAEVKAAQRLSIPSSTIFHGPKTRKSHVFRRWTSGSCPLPIRLGRAENAATS